MKAEEVEEVERYKGNHFVPDRNVMCFPETLFS